MGNGKIGNIRKINNFSKIGRIGNVLRAHASAIAVVTMVTGGCLAGTASVQAAPVTLQFTFSVDQLQDNGDLFGTPLQIGDKVQAAFTFDAATPDSEADPAEGFYVFFGAPNAFTLQTPHVITGDEFFGMVSNDGPDGDVFTLWGYAPINFGNFDQGSMVLSIVDPSHTWLSSDALPTSLSSITQLAGVQASFLFKATRTDQPFEVGGHLAFDGPNDPPAVPEPASLTLLGTGLIGLVKLRRVRRTSAPR